MTRTVDLPTLSPSQTMPQGSYLFDRVPVVDSALGTPRFGWGQDARQSVVTQECRFIVETSLVESHEDDEDVEALFSWTSTGMALATPVVTGSTGTGYRSPYRVSLESDCGAMLARIVDRQSETYSFSPLQEMLRKRWASGAGILLNEIPIGIIEEQLLPMLRKLLPAMHERISADAKELVFTEETTHETLIPSIEHETHIGAVRWLEEHAGLSQGAIAELLGVSRQTVQNWLKGDAIRDENRQRLLAVREILQRVQRTWQGADALKTWLDTPNGPDARTPRQLLMNNEIGRARALALSSASPRPRSAPAWLRESPADEWTLRQIRRRERRLHDQPELDIDLTDAQGGE